MAKRPNIIFRYRYEPRSRLNYRNPIFLVLVFLASFGLIFHLFPTSDDIAIRNCSDLDDEDDNIGDEEGQTSHGEMAGSDGNDLVPSGDMMVRSEDSKISYDIMGDPSPNGNGQEPYSSRRLPQCLIIGVRKGGTRALLEFLNLHPAVQKASDEVHFFDDDEKYRQGLEWYRSQMPFSLPDQITIEKSPAYFVTDSAPHRIHAMNSSIKLILIVRDPVTRLISDYAQLAENKARRNDGQKMVSFEQTVLTADGSVNIYYKPVRTSIYSIYFTRWAQIFPSQQIHLVDGDRLVYNPFPEVQRVEKFLNLAPHIDRDNFIYNSTKGFYCVKINGTLEKCLNESKGRPHPDVDIKVIRTLRRFYSPYNHRFYKMTGMDFGWPEI